MRLLLLFCSIIITCLCGPAGRTQQGGTAPGSSTAALRAMSNSIVTLAPLSELVPYSVPAAQAAHAYRVRLLRAGGPDIQTNGVLRRMIAGLTILYQEFGRTSVVDAAWYWPGWHVGSGSNLFTLSGSTPDMMKPSGLTWTNNGIHFTNAFVRYLIPDSTHRTLSFEVALRTNAIANQWLLSNVGTNITHSQSARLSIGSSEAPLGAYSVWTANAGVRRAGYLNGRVAGGLASSTENGLPFPKHLCASTDGTNAIAFIDGLPCLTMAANAATNPPSPCTALYMGNVDKELWGGMHGSFGCWVALNISLVGNSNGMAVLDRAMAVWQGRRQVLVVGDAFSEVVDTARPGASWVTQMHYLSGMTNSLSLEVQAFTGKTAAGLLAEAQTAAGARAPWATSAPGIAWVFAGSGDIMAGSTAPTVFAAISNLCRELRFGGYQTHVVVPTPIGTSAPGYSVSKSNEMTALRPLILGATNNPAGPMNRVWDTWTTLTNVALVNDVNVYPDGLAWSYNMKQEWGRHVLTRWGDWFTP